MTLEQREYYRANLYNAFMLASKEEINNGKLWYLNARRICKQIARDKKLKLITVCGVMAALSPFCSWQQNIKDTRGFLEDFAYNPVTFKNNVNKAWDILELDKPTTKNITAILKGQKISRFFLNIYSRQYNTVTIDRHAISLYFGTLEHNFVETSNRMRVIREDFKRVASELNLKPYQFQAIVWQVWKRLIESK